MTARADDADGDGGQAPTVAHALDAARRGLPVLAAWWPTADGCACHRGAACERPGKHPIPQDGWRDGETWLERATTDETQIRARWARHPRANVLLAVPAGMVVLDVDPRHAGDDTLHALEERLGALPDTWRVETGGGGSHIYLTIAAGAELIATVPTGIDVQTTGRLVVGPGSLHASGRRYERAADGHPDDVALAEVPEAWLRALVRPAADDHASDPRPESTIPLDQRVRRAMAYVERMPPAISGQGGHAATWAVAVALVRGFLLPREQAREVLDAYSARCRPRWSVRDVAHKLADAERARLPWGYLLDAREREPEAPEPAEPRARAPRSQADEVAALARDALDPWHAPDGEAYADLRADDGHRETHPVRSRAMRDYLARLYYLRAGRSLRAEALREALGVVEAWARYDGPERPVYLRTAEHEGAIHLDLGDARWRAIEVTGDGWRIIDEPPIRFRRARGMLALPEPERGGSLAALRDLLRVESATDWHQVLGWLLAALRPRGPYPVLALGGEPGASKSTAARIVRSLVDPSVAPLRSEPREGRDLIVAARNGWTIALDNVSRLQPWLSDALCRLATGGGYSARELFSDLDEVVIDVQRPVILTGIEDVCTRSDLADRAIAITLPPMPEEDRRPERALVAALDRVRPVILGALLEAVARGVRDLPTVRLDRLPRMADYAEWLAACEPALGVERGTMLRAYAAGRASMTATTIEASAVGAALLAWAQYRREPWEGTAAELLELLGGRVADEVRRDRHRWPQHPRGLSGALRRLAPALRTAGVDVAWHRSPGGGSRRVVTVATVASVARPAAQGPPRDGRGDDPSRWSPRPSHPEPAPGADCDGGDGRDGHDPAPDAPTGGVL